MLRAYIHFKQFKRIPHCGDTYEVSVKGELRETVSKKPIEHELVDGVPCVPNTIHGWFRGIEIGKLLSIVFRNPTQDVERLLQFNVLYRDGNPSNFALTNTIWKCPEGEHTHPLYPGFCYIPGYSRYLINRQGELLSPKKGGLLSPYQDGNGYLMYGVQPDVGKRTIVGMHRLKALAFLEYPFNVDKLDVNHIDGIQYNNADDNIEWATRSANNLHAFESGLMKSKAVLVRDITTGNVQRYYSIEECARCLNVDGETIRLRSNGKRKAKGVYSGLFQFKFEDDKTPWDIHENVSDYDLVQTKRSIQIESINTGNERVFETVTEAAKFFGTSTGTISYQLKKSNTNSVVFNGFLMKYAD